MRSMAKAGNRVLRDDMARLAKEKRAREAAYEACRSINPDNPQAVAEVLPELVDLAKAVLSLGKVLPDDTSEKPSVIFGHPNGIDWAELFLTAKDALAKIEGKA